MVTQWKEVTSRAISFGVEADSRTILLVHWGWVRLDTCAYGSAGNRTLLWCLLLQPTKALEGSCNPSSGHPFLPCIKECLSGEYAEEHLLACASTYSGWKESNIVEAGSWSGMVAREESVSEVSSDADSGWSEVSDNSSTDSECTDMEVSSLASDQDRFDLNTLSAIRLHLCRSTTIRCSLRSTVLLSHTGFYQSKRRINSTLAQENRKLCKKAESSGDSRRLSSLRRMRNTESFCSSSPLKLAPYFKQPIIIAAPTSPCMSNGPMMKQICCARVRATVALAQTSSFWEACSFSRSPLRKPTLVWAIRGRPSYQHRTHAARDDGTTWAWYPLRVSKGIDHFVSVVEDRQITLVRNL